MFCYALDARRQRYSEEESYQYWWDLSGGTLTEIDYLNGVVVDEGKKLGVACPANEKIVAMIHQAEHRQRQTGIRGSDLLSELKA